MPDSSSKAFLGRPGKMPAEPYFELPISLSKLRRLMQFRLGSHDLPIEQGRMAMPVVPRYLRRCTLCSRHAPGDERHFMLECPQSDGIRAQYPDLMQGARDSMHSLMWHQNQKALSDFVIAVLDEPRTSTWTRPHRPCWPNGRSESLSLSLSLSLFSLSLFSLG